MIESQSAEMITQQSKKAILTIGEWELLEITSHHPKPDLSDITYIDYIRYNVG